MTALVSVLSWVCEVHLGWTRGLGFRPEKQVQPLKWAVGEDSRHPPGPWRSGHSGGQGLQGSLDRGLPVDSQSQPGEPQGLAGAVST